jgi:hypothetical protein
MIGIEISSSDVLISGGIWDWFSLIVAELYFYHVSLWLVRCFCLPGKILLIVSCFHWDNFQSARFFKFPPPKMLRSLQATSTPSIWGFGSFLLLPSSAARLKAAGVFFVTAWWQCYTFCKTSISILFQDRIACQQLMFTLLWFLFYRLWNARADISENQ